MKTPDTSVYLRDLDGTGSMHICAKGDDGAIEYRRVTECVWEWIGEKDRTYRANCENGAGHYIDVQRGDFCSCGGRIRVER